MKTFFVTLSVLLCLAAPLSAAEITPLSEVKRGTMVTVEGTVERILDKDEFRLADDTGTIRVYVGPNWVPAQPGDSITVSGFVDDGIGPLELYARVMTLADGSKVEFSHLYN